MVAQQRNLRAVSGGSAEPRRRRTAVKMDVKSPGKSSAAVRGRGRPKSRLTSAIAPGGSEREMLVILRAKLAEKLDGDVPTHSFDKLMRQFLQLDAKIRAIDAREAEAAADDDGDDDDDDFDDEAPLNI